MTSKEIAAILAENERLVAALRAERERSERERKARQAARQAKAQQGK